MFAIAASSSSRNASATVGLRAKYQARAASALSAASGCSRTVWLVTRSARQASLHHFPRNALHGAGIEHSLGSGEGTLVEIGSTRLNSSHSQISYAVFCLKKKKR